MPVPEVFVKIRNGFSEPNLGGLGASHCIESYGSAGTGLPTLKAGEFCYEDPFITVNTQHKNPGRIPAPDLTRPLSNSTKKARN